MKTFLRLACIISACIVGIASFSVAAEARVGDVSTWLGRLYAGDGSPALSAFLDNPEGFTADQSCNLYIADTKDNVVRKIDNSSKIISTIAGTGDYGSTGGAALKSKFSAPSDVEIGPSGELYVVDTESNAVRIIRNRAVTTWVKNLNRPTGLLIDGSTLYVSDTNNNRIIKATVPSGSLSTVVNVTKPGKLAILNGYLYVTTHTNSVITRINLATGVTSMVKDGLTDVDGVAAYNGMVYFLASDRGMYNEIWRYDPGTGTSTMLVHVVEDEWYNHASDILFCNSTMYLLFSVGSSVYTAALDGTNPVRIAGAHRYGDQDGNKNVLMLGRPKALVLSKDQNKIYILENHRFVVYDLRVGVLSFMAGSPMDNWRDGVGNNARLSGATQMVLSPDGTKLYFADRNNNRIRALVIDENMLETLTGAGAINQFSNDPNGYAEGAACPLTQERGVAGCAYFNKPMGIAITKDGRTLYVADTDNNRIRSVDVATGATALVAGSGAAGFKNATGAKATFRTPISLLLSKDGKKLYVVDQKNHAIREITLSTKKVMTLLGTGKAGYQDGPFKYARLSYPDTLAYGSGNTLYLSDSGSQRIRKIDLKKKTIIHFAGSGQRGSKNGIATKATFNTPKGLLMWSKRVLVADLMNDMIRAVSLK
ncbi:MAG: hypothetical protein V1907_01525 [Candidatus Kerfeldbacteria bacterium]